MTDEDKLAALLQFCNAYGTEDFTNFDVATMDRVVYSIGQVLNDRGGIVEMRSLFDQLGDVSGIRSLDLHWDGIGEWRAMLPGSELGSQSSESLRARIHVDDQPLEAEFFDGVLWTGEEHADLTGNFDLSMRVATPIPLSMVLELLTIRMPWGNHEATLNTIASRPLQDGLSVTLVADKPAPWPRDRSFGPSWAEVCWGDAVVRRITVRPTP